MLDTIQRSDRRKSSSNVPIHVELHPTLPGFSSKGAQIESAWLARTQQASQLQETRSGRKETMAERGLLDVSVTSNL